MKHKKIIIIVIGLAILCVCIFFIMSNKVNQNFLPKDSTLIYEETVSPNEEYVLDSKDIVYYTIWIYRGGDNTIYVYGDSNSAASEEIKYTVSFDQTISKDDIQIKWTTLMGSTEATENDELGLAEITISKDGDVVNDKVVSFVSRGIKALSEALR